MNFQVIKSVFSTAMVKFAGRFGGFGIFLFMAGVLVFPSEAQDSLSSPKPGICQLPFQAGRMVVAPNGELVSLSDYCAQPVEEPSTGLVVEQSYAQLESSFWQAFVTAASPSALEFAESVGEEKVVEYGASICLALRNGQSLDDLRRSQSDGRTSAAFEAAVTVAAVITDCPEFRSQLGRPASAP